MKPITPRWKLLSDPEYVADIWEHFIFRAYPPSMLQPSPGARIDLCRCRDKALTAECDRTLVRLPLQGTRDHYCTQPSQECAHRVEGVYASPPLPRKPSPRPRPFADTKRLKAMECYVVLCVRRISEHGPKHLRPIAAAMLAQDLKRHPYEAQRLVFTQVAKSLPDDKPWEAA